MNTTSAGTIRGITFDFHAAFTLQNELGPCLDLAVSGACAFADSFREYFHPAILLCGAVGVEIDDLAVTEANAEAFLNEHVAFFLFRERRLSTAATPCGSLLLG